MRKDILKVWFPPVAGYLLTCFLCYLYFHIKGGGVMFAYGDTWIYTDMAKRIALNHSLSMTAIFDLIYPPLYPLLISVAYWFHHPDHIYSALKFINIAVYSSAFFPIYFLAREYVKLSVINSWAIGVLLLINMWLLLYATFITSEALYIPLSAWMTLMIYKKIYMHSRWEWLLFAIALLAFPLTKSLGAVLYPTLTIYTLWLFFNKQELTDEERKVFIIRTIAAIVFSIFCYLAYKKYLSSVLPQNGVDITGGYLPYLTHPNNFKLSYWWDRFSSDFFWPIFGTYTLMLPILCGIFSRKFKLLLKDPLVVFASLVFLGTAFVVPLFTPTDSLKMHHARYYMPFLFLWFLILFKYIQHFSKKDIFIGSFVLLLNSFWGYIIPVVKFEAFLKMKIPNGPYVVAITLAFFFALWFFYRFRKNFIPIFMILMALSTTLFFVRERGNPSNSTSFFDEQGMTRIIVDKRDSTLFVVDKGWRGEQPWMEYNHIMINVPLVPFFTDEVAAKELAKSKDVLFLTNRNVAGAVQLAEGNKLFLYQMTH